MSELAKRRVTRADLEKLPETVVGEIIAGVLIETSSPGGRTPTRTPH